MSKAKGSKGQIFTADMLLAILGITIMLGVAVHYQTMIENQGKGINYEQMKMIANDASQITVKRTGIDKYPNTAVSSNTGDLSTEKYTISSSGCNGEEVATSKRIVTDSDGNIDYFTVWVCRGD